MAAVAKHKPKRRGRKPPPTIPLERKTLGLSRLLFIVHYSGQPIAFLNTLALMEKDVAHVRKQ
jgi:hypothetical protein